MNSKRIVHVTFHIFSLTGRRVTAFLCEKSPFFHNHIQKIIFGSGCEFLICNREETDTTVNIYLREVEFGVGRNVVLWVDDKARETKFFKHRAWIKQKQ